MTARALALTLASSVLVVTWLAAPAAAYRTLADYPDFDGEGPIRWTASSIRYEIDPRPPRGLDYALWRAAVRDGAEVWQVACADVRFDVFTAPASPPRSGDGRSTVHALGAEWRELGYPTGVTGTTDLIYTYDPATERWALTEADVLVNDIDFDWSSGAGPREYDLQSLISHEFGHFLGLAHVCDEGGANGAPPCEGGHGYEDAVMYPYHDPEARTLGADDIAGIRYLYADPACAVCEEDQVRVEGVCVHRCVIEGCAAGEACRASGCALGPCIEDCDGGSCLCGASPVSDWGAPCASGTDCQRRACHEDGYCTASCESDGGCPADWTCTAGTCGRDGLLYGEACEYSSDCVTSHCIARSGAAEGVCSVECSSDADCPGADVCRTDAPGSFCVSAPNSAGGCSVGARGAATPWSLTALLSLWLLSLFWRKQ